MAIKDVDRKKLAETFHTWCLSRKDFHDIYSKCSFDSKDMIDDIFRKMENVNHFTFQSYYYRRATGWSKKTSTEDRRRMLCMGFRFLAEYGRGRIELGKQYKPYQSA